MYKQHNFNLLNNHKGVTAILKLMSLITYFNFTDFLFNQDMLRCIFQTQLD